MNNKIVLLKSDNNCLKISNPKRYVIDFDKIKSFEELKMLINILYESFNIVVQDDSFYYEQLKDYLKEEVL